MPLSNSRTEKFEMQNSDPERVTILQPAVPAYRLDFFHRIAASYPERFCLYASAEDMGALTAHATPPWQVCLPTLYRVPLLGLEWQPGALSIPLRQGDVLVICGAPRNLSTLLLLLRARRKGVVTIWWGHYWSATTRTWRFRLRMYLMRLSDAVLFYTDEEVTQYRARAGAQDSRRISAINNGIDIAPIRPLRTTYRAAERQPVLLFIGRLTTKARLDLLLKALADPTLGDVRLAVIGAGPEHKRLRALADGLGVAARIDWHGETTDEGRIAAVANGCRLFVYPGSVGLSLIHAMAYGLPAVVHDDRWTHMPEIAAFTEGRTGYSFPAGDPSGLAKTLAHTLKDDAALDAASAEALGRAERTFNTAHMAERMVNTIEALIR